MPSEVGQSQTQTSPAAPVQFPWSDVTQVPAAQQNVLRRVLETAGSEPSLLTLLAASAAGVVAWRQAQLESERSKVQPAQPARRPTPLVPRVLPREVGEAIARQRTRSAREEIIRLLYAANLRRELEHLLSIEERLAVGSLPAHHHAALSTRLLLKGIADRFYPPNDQPSIDRYGKPHPMGDENVSNRIAAFVDLRLRDGLSDEEHRLFIATLNTVTRWCGRGPHRIYNDEEAGIFLLRLFDLMQTVSRAVLRPTG